MTRYQDSVQVQQCRQWHACVFFQPLYGAPYCMVKYVKNLKLQDECSSRCPEPGEKRMALTPLECPDSVRTSRFGMKHVSLSFLRSFGGSTHERPA